MFINKISRSEAVIKLEGESEKTNPRAKEKPVTIFDSLDELNEGVCMFKFMAAAALAINQTSYKDLNDDEQFGMQTTLQAISDKLDNVKDSINSQLRKSHD